MLGFQKLPKWISVITRPRSLQHEREKYFQSFRLWGEDHFGSLQEQLQFKIRTFQSLEGSLKINPRSLFYFLLAHREIIWA